MKRFSDSLKQEMDDLLRSIHSREHEPVGFCIPAINTVVASLERLKAFTLGYEFADGKEEVFFFRSVKPFFTSRLIYYREIYRTELSVPVGDFETEQRHYKNEIDKLKSFFDQHSEFYRYYRSGDTYLDKKFFRRGKVEYHAVPDLASLLADPLFSTSHDQILAHLLANEHLKDYLQGRLLRLSNGANLPANPIKPLAWTGSKVALVELLYALHAEGVLNSGTLSLKEMVGIFEGLLNINLGQYHKTFLEIRERKSERAKFLESLRKTLIQKMEITDDL